MKRLLAYEVEGGGEPVVFEVEVSEAEEGVGRVGRGQELVERAERTLEDALDRLAPATQTVMKSVGSMLESPEEVTVSFGIKVSGSVGALIASSTGEANFTVSATWRPGARPAGAE